MWVFLGKWWPDWQITALRTRGVTDFTLHFQLLVAAMMTGKQIIGHWYSLISSCPLTHWFVFFLSWCKFTSYIYYIYITLIHCAYTYIDAANEDVSRQEDAISRRVKDSGHPGLHYVRRSSYLVTDGWCINLVGGLEHEFYFSISWECHICHHPNWRTHIFQRGRSTTNQKLCELSVIGAFFFVGHKTFIVKFPMKNCDFP